MEALLKAKGVNEFNTGVFTYFNYRNYKWFEWKVPDGIRLEFVEIID